MMFVAMLALLALIVLGLLGVGCFILSIIFISVGFAKNKKTLKILSYVGFPVSVIILIPTVFIFIFLVERPDLHIIPENFVDAPTVRLENEWDEDNYVSYLIVEDTNERFQAIYFGVHDAEIEVENKYAYKPEYEANWLNYSTIKNEYGCEMIVGHGNVYVPENQYDSIIEYYKINYTVYLENYAATEEEGEILLNPKSHLSSDDTAYKMGSDGIFLSASKRSKDGHLGMEYLDDYCYSNGEYYIIFWEENGPNTMRKVDQELSEICKKALASKTSE